MRTTPLNRGLSLLAVGLVSLSLGACGDDEEDSSPNTQQPATTEQSTTGSGAAAAPIEIAAVEGGTTPYSFSTKRLNADAGEVTLSMSNPSGNQAPHAIEVEGNGVEEVGDTVQPGGTSTATADLKAGRYTFYCPVGNHRDEGMEGTLTVR